jgi:hypothetical protein
VASGVLLSVPSIFVPLEELSAEANTG